MMRKLVWLVLMFTSLTSVAQEDAWVYFSNKPLSATYFDNPLLMLSQRSLDRRTQQAIPLDIKDVPVHIPYIDQVENTAGIDVMAKSKWLNAVHVRGSVSDINALSMLPFVTSVQFADETINQGGENKPTAFRPAAANKTTETMANFSYGNSGNQLQMLGGHLLHQQDYTGTGKIIAVLDAGFPGVDIEQPFQRLQTNNLILGGYNFVDRNNDYYSRGSHGSLVLSTMGGYTENALVGSAPDASYYLFITEDITSENPVEESLWVEAAEAADSLGVDIINTSLGYFHYDNPNYSHTFSDMDGQSAFISRGANAAASRGMIVVVSAGNSGSGGDPNISAPADAPGVLTVGAVTPSGQYASFSSVGPTADGRIKPDVMAQGESAVLSSAAGIITTSNGTSFSSPITAGMIACLWQALPEKTAEQIKQLVRESAHLYATPNNMFGFGIPNYQQALLSGLGIDKDQVPSIALLPNPVTDRLTLQSDTNMHMSGSINLYNSLGQLVVSSVFSTTNPLHTDSLAPGVYLYRVSAMGRNFTGRIIKK